MPHISQAVGAAIPIVKDLANACILRFADVRGVGAGVGNASCASCVRLTAGGPTGPEYRYGHSQAHLLDADAIVAGGMFNPGNHAERQAHNAAGGAGYGTHLFVELPPCAGANGCAVWCAANIPLINVWWLYPDTATMVARHAAGTASQFQYLNAQLP